MLYSKNVCYLWTAQKNDRSKKPPRARWPPAPPNVLTFFGGLTQQKIMVGWKFCYGHFVEIVFFPTIFQIPLADMLFMFYRFLFWERFLLSPWVTKKNSKKKTLGLNDPENSDSSEESHNDLPPEMVPILGSFADFDVPRVRESQDISSPDISESAHRLFFCVAWNWRPVQPRSWFQDEDEQTRRADGLPNQCQVEISSRNLHR